MVAQVNTVAFAGIDALPIEAQVAISGGLPTCTGVVEGKFQSGLNNGYPSAFWTLGCEHNKASGLGETHYTKAIQGAGALYILSRIWRTPAYGKQGPNILPREIDGAVAFLTSSVVCDANSKQSPCPE